uniref:DUF4218 domain-containing protein n=1 Tax=Arundo donax TaxID=35708 RepID=A0A0A9BUP2_ARUDO
MYHYERFMSVLKKYVRNRARPEGCMAQAWETEEVIKFVLDYMDLKIIGKPVSRHEGKLNREGARGHKKSILII